MMVTGPFHSSHRFQLPYTCENGPCGRCTGNISPDIILAPLPVQASSRHHHAELLSECTQLPGLSNIGHSLICMVNQSKCLKEISAENINWQNSTNCCMGGKAEHTTDQSNGPPRRNAGFFSEFLWQDLAGAETPSQNVAASVSTSD